MVLSMKSKQKAFQISNLKHSNYIFNLYSHHFPQKAIVFYPNYLEQVDWLRKSQDGYDLVEIFQSFMKKSPLINLLKDSLDYPYLKKILKIPFILKKEQDKEVLINFLNDHLAEVKYQDDSFLSKFVGFCLENTETMMLVLPQELYEPLERKNYYNEEPKSRVLQCEGSNLISLSEQF